MKKVIFTLLALFSIAAQAAPEVTNHLHVSEVRETLAARDSDDKIYPCKLISAEETKKYKFSKHVKGYIQGTHRTMNDVVGGLACGKDKVEFVLAIVK